MEEDDDDDNEDDYDIFVSLNNVVLFNLNFTNLKTKSCKSFLQQKCKRMLYCLYAASRISCYSTKLQID